jgi:hypothetical protein
MSTDCDSSPISVTICSLFVAAIPRSVSDRYGFAIGSLCADPFLDALAARTSVLSKDGANELRDSTGGTDALILREPMGPFIDEARPQVQTGGRWHLGTDGAAGAAGP